MISTINEIKVDITTSKKGDKEETKYVLALDTCSEYAFYLAQLPRINDYKGSENFVPKDAMTLKELGQKKDAEIIGIINKMSLVPHKSDIRVMYANGYGFSWTKLTTIAEFKGYHNTAEGTNTPHYVMEGIKEVVPDNTNNPTSIIQDNSDKKTIYIERGTRDNSRVRKFTFTEETNRILDELMSPLCNLEKSKVIECILVEPLTEVLNLKREGKLSIKYKAMAEESIL